MNQAELLAAQRRHSGLLNLPIGVRFSRLSDGRAVVYPWPWPLRVGCILPDHAAEVRLRSTMRRWLWAAMPVFVIFALLGPRRLLAASAVYIGAYYTRLLIATLGLLRTDAHGDQGWKQGAETGPAHNLG